MFSKTLSILSLLVAQVYSMSVLLPLYVYPGTPAWNSYVAAIKATPSVTFRVIVNPANGPGSDAYPDAQWIAGIAALRNYTNVQLLGYVHTTQATRLITDVTADIKHYDAWKAYSQANIAMDGIFFDEAPSKWTLTTSNYMRTAVSTADTAWKSVSTTAKNATTAAVAPYIVFNPGVSPDPQFFQLANNILVWENSYWAYTSNVIAAIPSQYASQATVMIHTFDGSLNDQAQIVKKVWDAGISHLFISDQADYDGISTVWSQFCTAWGG